MPKLYGKQDVGINLLGGIFQSMLNRRQRNQDLQDQEAQRQQASQMQEQRQVHGINLVEMQDRMARGRTMESREYKEEQGATPEEWKQYMQEKGIPYTGKWSTDKWSIDRYDDQQQEQARAAAKAKTGVDEVKRFSGGSLIKEIEKQFPRAEVEMRRKIQTAYNDSWERGGKPSVLDVGNFVISGGGIYIDVPTIRPSGQELFNTKQELKGMFDAEGLTKNMKPEVLSELVEYIIEDPNAWYNEKLAKPLRETIEVAQRNLTLESTVYSAMQFVPEAKDHSDQVIDPLLMEQAYYAVVGEHAEPLGISETDTPLGSAMSGLSETVGGMYHGEFGRKQQSVNVRISVAEVISAMEDAGVDPMVMVDIFERYQTPNLGADQWRPSPAYGTKF